MAAVRRDITANAADAANFRAAVLALKADATGIMASDLGIGPGPRAGDRELSFWDLFVIWHVWAMEQMSVDGRRNAAHMGPVFLPWHRWYLLLLEFHMQRALGVGRDDFGLPYWDWATDGERTPTQQRNSLAVWDEVGGNGQGPFGEVVDGPFTPAGGFDVAVEQGPTGRLRATRRPLRRRFGVSVNRLPRQADEANCLADPTFDRSTWDASSDGFRNKLEGWVPSASAPAMHNRVHVWVGGDMGPGTSPNDPVFFLNHCNVDRIWDAWQRADGGRTYLPPGRSQVGDPLFRQRRLDPLYSILTTDQPPIAALEDVSAFYVYG